MDDLKRAKTVVVTNPQGLHMRPLDMFTKTASRFASRIEVVHGRRRVDGKSILDLLTLGATQGTELCIEATGHDAESALEALAELFVKQFAENGNAK